MKHGHMRQKIFLSVLSLAVLTLGGCSAPPPGPSKDGVDLRGAALGAPFTLTSGTGETVTWDDFKGKYRIVYFGYTFCPDICPTDVARFSAGLEEFERANPELGAKIQPIFITVDPERDTPAKLREFTQHFHKRLIGLTGTPEVIKQVSAKFAASATQEPANEAGAYLVNHSALTYLFGPNGEPLGTLPTDKGAKAVAAELQQWIR